MEASIVGAVVGASIQVLLQNLLDMSQEKISLFRDFEHDLEELKDSFYMVMEFLYDAEKIQVNNMAVRIWLRNLEALAFEADNVFDEIDYELLSKKVGATRNKTVKKKVQSFFSTSNKNPILNRLKLGRRIKEVNEKLKCINQQAIGFGLQTIAAQAPMISGPDHESESRETDSFSADPVFLGRENDVSTIVEMLINTSSLAEKGLSVLPIVGMGGLGKTTLARKVFDDLLIKSHFKDNRVWVYVSRNFDVTNILKNIFASLTGEKFEIETREALLKNIQKHLGTQTYLLVLDDHWNGERDKWDSLINSLLGISSATGNCMIVTTRSEGVASIVETLPSYRLKGLADEKCWSIIKAKAFTTSGDIPLEFETVGTNIAKRCKGMPLAAKVVGGLLFGKSKDEWVSIEKNWLLDFGDESHMISKILKSSFDHLSPPSLKKCFAYCSIFPKGHLLKKEYLVELWMAEGFLQARHERRNINMETTGTKFFNILMQNSLLQFVSANYCYMHDLVHDLACSVMCENDIVTEGTYKSRYIGYETSGDGLLSIPKGQERHVRTLFFDGKISDIKFPDFESLHTLTLVGEDTDNLPTSIRELKHLRYLDISGTSIRTLPKSIGELYHLQTLRANQSSLTRLPDSLGCLTSLMHLHICDTTTLPPGIGKLTSLQNLPYFHVGSKKGCGISELGKLKDLKGKLWIRNIEKVRDKKEAMSANLIQKSGIVEINLVWGGSRAGDESNVDESVLEGLQPHFNLESLTICGFGGKIFPRWTSKMAVQLDDLCWEGLKNLVRINLTDCSEVEELPSLGQLRNLKSIELQNLSNVKSIGPSFYGIDGSGNDISHYGVCTRNVVVFPALERLWLEDMTNLKEWDDFPLQPSEVVVVVFPCLKFLKIQKCGQLMRAPSHFPSLEKLEIEKMESGFPLENICGMMLTTLTHLKICGFRGKILAPRISNMAVQLDDLCWEGLNNLVRINLTDCSEVEKLPSLGQLRNLKSIELRNLSNVKSIRPSFYGIDGSGNDISHNGVCTRNVVVFPALERLWLEDMTNLKEWDDLPLQPSEVVVVVFPCLEHLKIQRCGQLMRAPSHFPSLEKLEIEKMKSGLPLENICGMMLTTLTHLKIRGIKDLECLPDGVFSNNHNLSELWIYDCDNMTHLVPLIRPGGGAPSLRELRIFDCSSLRELPDDLHSLNSLEKLVIDECPDLKSIPFPSSRGGRQQQHEQGLTSLKELRISNYNSLTNLPIEMLESCALSLEELTMSRLTNTSEVIGCCLHKMSRLTSLKISGVSKFSIISSSIRMVSSPERLEMVPSYSDSSWNNVSFNETVDAMLLQFTSLRKLRLDGM